MANSRGGGKPNAKTTSCSGPWIDFPLDFLRSRAWCELSSLASKMLIDLVGQLQPYAKNNGDICIAESVLEPRGWTSLTSRQHAVQELIEAGLLVVTRRPDKRRCGLYAITLWPMNCDFDKLEHKPGFYSTTDWMYVTADAASRPTPERPAVRRQARKVKSGPLTTGGLDRDKRLSRVVSNRAKGQYPPTASVDSAISATSDHPPQVSLLHSHVSKGVQAVGGVDLQPSMPPGNSAAQPKQVGEATR